MVSANLKNADGANKCRPKGLDFLPRAMKTLLLLLLMSGVLAAAEQKDWKGIAGVSGTDKITQIHIANLLLPHDIESIMEGSVVYGISVPPAQADQASRILRTDAQKLGYYILFGRNDVVRAAKLKQLISHSPVSLVLKKSEYGADKALGRFLRSKDISQLTIKYPVIGSLSVHERQYLATPKTFNTGYDVEIVLQKSLGEKPDGYRGNYQIYDGGIQVAFLGSSEWKAGEK
jgi:hypothetical protein